MVPSPPRGERDNGRNSPLEEGSQIPTLISDMEIEKGKGIVIPYDPIRDGEGSSGIKKEEATNQETRRT